MKIGLYSITYLGIWYAGRALSIEEVFDRAVKYGYSGVEIDGKRPHGHPLDWDPERRKRIRNLAEAKGLEIIGVAANNNFVSPFDEQREAELMMVAELIRLCHDLGGKVVRLFTSWNGITRIDGLAQYDVPGRYGIRGINPGPDASMLQRWNWAKELFKECAGIAEKNDVTLALQNHHPFLMHSRNTYLDMLEMVAEVGSGNFKCSLDCGLLDDQSDEAVAEAVRNTGSLQAVTHCFGEFARDESGRAALAPIQGIDFHDINYPVFIKTLKEIGYQGYCDFEFCHTPLSKDHRVLGIERIDEQVGLFHEYMSGLIQNP